MARPREPEQIQITFTFNGEAELNVLIANHRSQHERANGTRLAMQGRRDLGAGRVMITFRVVDKAR